MKIHGYPTGFAAVLLVVAGGAVLACVAAGAVIARLWRARWWIGGVIGFVVALLLAAGLALAQSGRHGDGHAQHHDWYEGKQSPAFAHSCCNARKTKPDGTIEGDCRPVRALLGDDGIWRAIVDGRPVRIPPRVVLRQIAPDGNAHICMSKAGTIYCFLESQPKS